MKCLICEKILGRITCEVTVKSFNSKRKIINTVLHPICFDCVENINFRRINDRIINIGEEKQYKESIKVWGLDLQFGMLSEECGELLAVVNQWRRGRATDVKVCREMADVMIMIRQIMVVMNMKLSDNLLGAMIRTKLKKMEKQLEKSKKK